jgi:siroheme synthase-like protein
VVELHGAELTIDGGNCPSASRSGVGCRYDAGVTSFLPVALPLDGARALVIGGDHEAVDKAQRLVAAGARVTVVAESVDAPLAALAARGALAWYARSFVPEDARGMKVVVLAPRDEALASSLFAQARRDGFWLSAIDQPRYCDFVWVSVTQAGPVQISLSSGGTAPALLKRLRGEFERLFDARFAAFAGRVAALRGGLEGLSLGERRARMAAVLEGFALDARVRYPDWESAPDGGSAPGAVDPET